MPIYDRDEQEERALDMAEDAYYRHRLGEPEANRRPWPVWSLTTAEQDSPLDPADPTLTATPEDTA